MQGQEKIQVIFKSIFTQYRSDHFIFASCYKLQVLGFEDFWNLSIFSLFQNWSLLMILSLNQIYLMDCIDQEVVKYLFYWLIFEAHVQK